MKKLLTFVFLLLGLAISSNVFLLNAKSEVIHDTLFCSLKGKCSCGGNLQYTSKAYTIKKKCNPCKGTGKVRIRMVELIMRNVQRAMVRGIG